MLHETLPQGTVGRKQAAWFMSHSVQLQPPVFIGAIEHWRIDCNRLAARFSARRGN